MTISTRARSRSISLRPCIDATLDVVYDPESLFAEMLGGTLARIAVMAEECQRRFLRQLDQARVGIGIEHFGTRERARRARSSAERTSITVIAPSSSKRFNACTSRACTLGGAAGRSIDRPSPCAVSVQPMRAPRARCALAGSNMDVDAVGLDPDLVALDLAQLELRAG